MKPARLVRVKLTTTEPEPLKAACADRPGCAACGLWKTCKTPYLRPFIPTGWTRKFLLVGEGPGKDEDERSGRPFTGPAGQLLQRFLRKVNIDPVDVALVNAMRCRPPNNRTPKMAEIRACRPFLLRVITQTTPEATIALGATALKALTNDGRMESVTAARGRQLVVPGAGPVAAWVTYHPAAILHGASSLGPRIVEDLRRTWDWGALPRPPHAWPDGDTWAVDTEFAANGDLLAVGCADASVSHAVPWPDEGIPVRPSIAIQGHSVADDLQRLVAGGLPIPEDFLRGERVQDSLLLARLVDENLLSYELEDLLLSKYPVQPWKAATKALFDKHKDMREVPQDLYIERCRLDAWASSILANELAPRVPTKLSSLVHRIAATIARVCTAGLMIDLTRFQTMSDHVGLNVLRASDLLCRAAAAAGVPAFRPTNDRDIRALLYTHLGLEPQSYTETELPSVAKQALQGLDHDVARMLMEFNTWDKAQRVSVDGLRKLLHPCGALPDGRPGAYLPLNINPLGARTGRRSSNHPNSQNWPEEFRSIVVSRFAGGKIGDFDYSRLEPVLTAWLAGDEELLRVFTVGRGYADVASGLWGREVEDGTAEYKATKQVVLGTNYNMQPRHMAETLWYSIGAKLAPGFEAHVKAVRAVHKAYLRRFRGLSRYMDARRAELLSRQKVASAVGQVRHLPCPLGADTPGFGHLLNQAINFPIQCLASYVTGCAMLDVERELLRLHGVGYREWVVALMEDARKRLTWEPGGGIIYPAVEIPTMINEVHDDIVVDFPATNIERHTELIVESMRAIPELRALTGLDVPLRVGIMVSDGWCQTE